MLLAKVPFGENRKLIVRYAIVQEVEDDIFHCVLKQVEFTAHSSPYIDHMSPGDSDGRCMSEAPTISLFTESAVGLRLHHADLVSKVVLKLPSSSLYEVAPGAVVYFVASKDVGIELSNDVHNAVNEV